jgi:hypothetical protein
LIAGFALLAKHIKAQAEQIDDLTRRLHQQEMYWQAIGKPVRSKKDTGYFNDRGKLLALMDEYFNEEELIDLCFEFGVNYDKLLGVGVRGKSRSLIEYMERHASVYKLLDECNRRRPHVDWPVL